MNQNKIQKFELPAKIFNNSFENLVPCRTGQDLDSHQNLTFITGKAKLSYSVEIFTLSTLIGQLTKNENQCFSVRSDFNFCIFWKARLLYSVENLSYLILQASLLKTKIVIFFVTPILPKAVQRETKLGSRSSELKVQPCSKFSKFLKIFQHFRFGIQPKSY